MNEAWPVFEYFNPILIQNYIRFETAMHHLRNQDNGQTEASPITKFKISPEHYDALINFETTAPLLGLSLSYDKDNQILSAEPDTEFLETYKNAIMRDVAIKQSENCKVRYSKFIQVVK